MSFSVYAQKTKSHLLSSVTFALIAGIWFCTHKTAPFLPTLIIFSIIATTLISKQTVTQKIIQTTIVVLVFFSGNMLHIYQKNKQHQLQEIICEKFCTIRGTITAIEQSKQKFVDTVLTIHIKKLKNPGHWWRNTNATMQIQTKETEMLHVADNIEIQNIFFKKPNSISFNRYLLKNNIAATAFAPELNCKVLHRPWLSVSRWIANQKKRIYQNIKRKMLPRTFSFFSSIFLGNRAIKHVAFEKAKATFNKWGILHFLARSGLHLVIFVLLWTFALAFIPLPFFPKQIFLILLAFVYYFLSWTTLSFVRALSIFLLYKTGPLAFIRTNSVHLLLLVCFCTLLHNPVQLFFLDFQLSFGLAFALTCFGQLLQQKRPE